jgi:hypothetical protein
VRLTSEHTQYLYEYLASGSGLDSGRNADYRGILVADTRHTLSLLMCTGVADGEGRKERLDERECCYQRVRGQKEK